SSGASSWAKTGVEKRERIRQHPKAGKKGSFDMMVDLLNNDIDADWGGFGGKGRFNRNER
ncbi:MAG: hypothetical protein DWQ02_27100, partial [Bacteroidetes bacterium]